jgi:DNA-binding NtrC family response regulator
MERKPSILYVEDDPMLRDLIAEVLSGHDFVCIPAANGVDALRLIDASLHQFDILLSDVRMPGAVSGFDVADRFQAVHPQGEVILITGHLAPEDAAMAHKARRQVYTKPVRIADLLKILADATKRLVAGPPREAKVVRLNPDKTSGG